jgi:hypothetical protein
MPRACSWNTARDRGQLRADLAAHIHVNDLCEVFGYTKRRDGNYELVHKQAIANRLRQLDRLHAHGHCLDAKGRVRSYSGRYADVFFLGMPGFFGDEPYEFFVRPGIGMMEMVRYNAPTMQIHTSLARLMSKQKRAKGGRSNEYAARINVYVTGIFRFRFTKTEAHKLDPITVSTILARAGITQDARKDWPSKHWKERVESVEGAFDLLVQLGAIESWQFAESTGDDEPTFGWFEKWLHRKVVFVPPAAVLEAGKRALALQQNAVKDNQRQKRAVKQA